MNRKDSKLTDSRRISAHTQQITGRRITTKIAEVAGYLANHRQTEALVEAEPFVGPVHLAYHLKGGSSVEAEKRDDEIS